MFFYPSSTSYTMIFMKSRKSCGNRESDEALRDRAGGVGEGCRVMFSARRMHLPPFGDVVLLFSGTPRLLEEKRSCNMYTKKMHIQEDG